MPIEMPKGLPFSVDTWSESSKRKRHHFLTHAHKDHSQGISNHFSYPIYSTRLTKTLVLRHYHQLDDSLFVGIEVGQTLVIDDSDGCFSVTALDANHCPGAVMFLFEGNFGNILHTGDCRLTPECLQNLPEKYVGKEGKRPRCPLDFIFLDCTFGNTSLKFPSKHSAVRQVVNCIWKHPKSRIVYLTGDLLGQEEILTEVSRTFGSKIFVNKETMPECFHTLNLTVPEVLSEDSSTRFQMLEGFPRLYERAQAKLAEAKANLLPEPLIIRASAMWYVCESEDESLENPSQRKEKTRSGEAVRDQFGVWHICYSMHSSKEELEWALQLLAPKWVVSTTPSCRAMELHYVKKHCIMSRLAPDDRLWKLLDITPEASLATSDASTSIPNPSTTEDSTQLTIESQLQPVKTSNKLKRLLPLSPPRKNPPFTLFGRARLGIVDFTSSFEGRSEKSEEKEAFELKVEKRLEFNRTEVVDIEAQCDSKEVTEVESDKVMEKDPRNYSTASSPVTIRSSSSSQGFTESFRKLYRTMYVPVPRPLPSLVELMKSRKRAKISIRTFPG